jgi:aspartate aminotransferase-like enzyme
LPFNITVGGGLGDLAGKVWRIGLMGMNANERSVILVLEALERALKKEGYRVNMGSSIVAAIEALSS